MSVLGPILLLGIVAWAFALMTGAHRLAFVRKLFGLGLFAVLLLGVGVPLLVGVGRQGLGQAAAMVGPAARADGLVTAYGMLVAGFTAAMLWGWVRER